MKNTKCIILVMLLISLTACAKEKEPEQPQKTPIETKTPELTLVQSPGTLDKPTSGIDQEKTVEEIEYLLREGGWEQTESENIWYSTICGDLCGPDYIKYAYHLDLNNGEYYIDRYNGSEIVEYRESYFWNEEKTSIGSCEYSYKNSKFSSECTDGNLGDYMISNKDYFQSVINEIGITITDLNKLSNN